MLQNIKGILIGLTEEGDAEETSTARLRVFPGAAGERPRHGPSRVLEASDALSSAISRRG